VSSRRRCYSSDGTRGSINGILWTVWPLDERMKEWLNQTGVEYPSTPSRFPTGKEIKEVIGKSQSPGFNVRVNDCGVGKRWQALIVSELGGDIGGWANLIIDRFSGDDQEQELWFEKGSESLNILMLKRLAQKCGLLVPIADAGGDPQIVTA
jgi:hypothetical protein